MEGSIGNEDGQRKARFGSFIASVWDGGDED
jgi:hypothetical protein